MFWIFLFLMLLVTATVFLWGDKEQKFAIAILDASFVATGAIYRIGSKNWFEWPFGVFVVDTIAFLLLLSIALRSKRFWPLPIAALHFLPLMVPLAGLVGKNLASDALGKTQGIWGYLQLLILVIASMRNRKRIPSQPLK